MPEQAQTKLELRRDVSVWGSFMWGYADVGADVYVALGLVVAYAQGVAPLVFAIAGLIYIMIGLAYTELASAYPVAGGGQYFALRGLGDFWGYLSGLGLLFDYTIDIALFSVVSAGYLNFFMELLLGRGIETFVITIGPFQNVHYFWCLETLILILILTWLNYIGVRESSFVNEALGVIIIISESALVTMGFLFAWKPEFLALQWKTQIPTLHNFIYGCSLGIISYVGLESISQAAQETKRPATIIPRTSLTLIFTVFLFAVTYSILGLGILPWQTFAEHMDNPMAQLAKAIPIVGFIAGPLIAALGTIILFISSNTGVMGASRIAYSLSGFKLMSPWFSNVHPKYRTPARSILIFSAGGILLTILSFLTPSAMDTLGNIYAFGATLGYTMVFIALIRLRFVDPYTPRPYMMPLNLKLSYKGRKIYFPILGVIGTLGVVSILFTVVFTHSIGRIAGPAWVILGFLYYFWYRKKQGLPLLKSIKRDWEKEQIEVLTAAEEYDLLEQYKNALAERDKKRVKKK